MRLHHDHIHLPTSSILNPSLWYAATLALEHAYMHNCGDWGCKE
jgi:hypothetical protein